MDSVQLSKGIPGIRPRAGETLVIVNHPGLDWTKRGNNGIPIGAAEFVIVGFDRTPSAGSYDASVPPFTRAVIPVPANCRQVYLLWPSDSAATPMLAPVSITLQVSWTSNVEAANVEFLSLLPVPYAAQAWAGFTDCRGDAFSPGIFASVLDQIWTGMGNPTFRPVLAPSKIVTASLVLAANTLTDIPALGGQTNLNGQGSPVLLALCASVTAPGLVVIGTPNLTIGSPGLGEVLRRRAAAAGPLPDLQLGQGLDMAFSGHGTPVWCCYASAALTLDLTAFIG